MAQTKKVQSKQLPPVKSKTVLKTKEGTIVGPQPMKKMVMTADDVKKVMLENQALHETVRKLTQDNEMLGKILLTAGITVDEKFGDAEIDEVRVPSMKEVSGYKEVSSNNSRHPLNEETTDWDEDSEDMD